MQRVYLVLKNIGRPAHFSKITERYNLMFPEEPSKERNIHAVLGRGQYGIVWVGVKGTYALKEWGYKKPQPMINSSQEIVERIYNMTGNPVPFTTILAEVGKDRQILNPSSLLIALSFNPNLKRVFKDFFVPKYGDDQYHEEVSDEELDEILKKYDGYDS